MRLLRRSADPRRGAARDPAHGHHRHVGPQGLHGPRRAARPGVAARGPGPLLRRHAAVFESHGGTIEKIIGDAIVAVFGLPVDRRGRRAAGRPGGRRDPGGPGRPQRAAGPPLGGPARQPHRDRHRRGRRRGRQRRRAHPDRRRRPAGEQAGAVGAPDGGPDRRSRRIGSWRIGSRWSRSTPCCRRVPACPCRPSAWSRSTPWQTTRPWPPAGGGADARSCPNCGVDNPPTFRRCGSCGAQLVAKRARETRKTVTIVFADLKATTVGGEPLAPDVLRTSWRAPSRRPGLPWRGTAARSRSSSAMRSWPSSACPSATRTTRCGPSAPRSRCGCAGDPRRDAGARPRHPPRGRHRRQHRRGRRGRREPRPAPGDRRRGQRRGPPGAGRGARARSCSARRPSPLVRDVAEVEEVEPLALKGKSQPVPAYRLLAVRSADASRRRHERRDGRPRGGDGAPGRRVRERGRRPRLPDGHPRRRRRRRQDAPDPGVPRLGRRTRPGRPGPLPPVWRGHHVLADRRGRRRGGRHRGDGPPGAAREKLRALVGDEEVADRVAAAVGLLDAPFQVARAVLGHPPLLRDPRRGQAAGGPLRRHPLGRADVPGPHRAPDRLDGGRAGHAPVHGAPGAPGEGSRRGRRGRASAASSWPASRTPTRRRSSRTCSARPGWPSARGPRSSPPPRATRCSSSSSSRCSSTAACCGFVDGRWEPTGDLAAIAIPPTIHALLAARLDQLPEDERAVVDPASVIGLVFAQAALQAIVDDDVRAEVPTHLDELESRQLVRRQTADGRRGRRVPLRPPDDPRRDLRRPPQAHAGAPPRAVRGLGGRGQPRGRPSDRVRGDPRLPPRAGASLPVRARPARRARRRPRHRRLRAPGLGRPAGLRARRHAGHGQPRRGARPALLPDDHPARPRLLLRPGLALWETGDYEAADAALDAAARRRRRDSETRRSRRPPGSSA